MRLMIAVFVFVIVSSVLLMERVYSPHMVTVRYFEGNCDVPFRLSRPPLQMRLALVLVRLSAPLVL